MNRSPFPPTRHEVPTYTKRVPIREQLKGLLPGQSMTYTKTVPLRFRVK